MHASFYIPKYIIKFNTKSHKLLNEAGRGIKIPKESYYLLFVCVEVLQPSQHNEVMSSAVNLSNQTFTGQA